MLMIKMPLQGTLLIEAFKFFPISVTLGWWIGDRNGRKTRIMSGGVNGKQGKVG